MSGSRQSRKIYLTVLEDQRSSVEMVIRNLQENRGKTVQALIDEGIVSRSDLFGDLLRSSEHPGSFRRGGKNIELATAQRLVDAALRQNTVDELQHRLQQYDTSLSALRALIATHEQFQVSGTVDTASVDALTSQLASEAALKFRRRLVRPRASPRETGSPPRPNRDTVMASTDKDARLAELRNDYVVVRDSYDDDIAEADKITDRI